MDERNIVQTEVCMDCMGAGVVVIPAYSYAGEIIDETIHPCTCTLDITD